MHGKVLIVDAIATNRIVLKVKLASAFYQVLQAGTVAESLQMAVDEAPDLIIAAIDLPDGGAASLCKTLGKHGQTRHIPVMALACKPQGDARMAALEAGAHDVLSKPFDDVWLLGRVRSLIRAYNASAEWRLRDDTSAALGMAEPDTGFTHRAKILMVSNDSARAQHWRTLLRPLLSASIALSTGGDVLPETRDAKVPDAFVLVQPTDPVERTAILRLISFLRANAVSRHAAILVVQTKSDSEMAAQALDLGADDVMIEGFEEAELALRLKALLLRKRTDANMRATYRTGMEEAVYDPLTGLHNRRYAMPHLDRVSAHSQRTGHPFAVMVGDLDHFKQINDIYGHASGDAVLVEVASRLRASLRRMDLVARIGGEEFMIVMPATTAEEAREAAVRICQDIGELPFKVPGHPEPISVTISIGMAIGESTDMRRSRQENPAELLDQADKALYSAKMRGRNRVTLGRPAA
ncbi:MAG: diguanylate cyclase [Sulfitobacter sp.]